MQGVMGGSGAPRGVSPFPGSCVPPSSVVAKAEGPPVPAQNPPGEQGSLRGSLLGPPHPGAPCHEALHVPPPGLFADLFQYLITFLTRHQLRRAALQPGRGGGAAPNSPRESQTKKSERRMRKRSFSPHFRGKPSRQAAAGTGGACALWGDTLEHRGQPRAGKFWHRRVQAVMKVGFAGSRWVSSAPVQPSGASGWLPGED